MHKPRPGQEAPEPSQASSANPSPTPNSMITPKRPLLRWTALAVATLNLAAAAQTDERVFSGPQPGEKTTSFKALELRGPNAGQERDPIAEYKGAPVNLVFVHGVERSMASLMAVLDEYGKERKDLLKTEFVFLSNDRLSSQQRLPRMGESLKLASPMSLSIDGIEGPGNYGLNKECLMTVVVAKDNRVAANFALVQPGIADAERILTAIAKVIGDANPPTPEALRERRGAGYGRMTPAQMENRRELASRPKGDLPGAAPTDAKLVALLRRFIQKSNEDATVDKVLSEVEAYVKDSGDLRKQAIDGWTRVLHLKYGTEYAQKAATAWLAKLEDKK